MCIIIKKKLPIFCRRRVYFRWLRKKSACRSRRISSLLCNDVLWNQMPWMRNQQKEVAVSSSHQRVSW